MAQRQARTCRSDGETALRSPERTPEAGETVASAAPGLRPIAAFDFDGTLTTRDSFTAFLRWRTSRAAWLNGLASLAPTALRYLLDHDRGRLKAAAVRAFLQGTDRDRLEDEAERFAATAWCALMRPDALQAWAAHGERGDLRVIVTASPEEVVAPFARRLGADVLIGSRLQWTADGRVGAGLDGPNCRGQEKVRRLRARFGPEVRLADAYGDTAGDEQMLALADTGHMRLFRERPVPRIDTVQESGGRALPRPRE